MTAANFDRRYLLMAAAGVFVLIFVIYPLWQVLFRSFLDAGVLSLKSYQKVFSYPSYYRALLNSVWISCATAAMCMVLGTLLAFLVVRTDLPGKRTLRTLLVLPYALPSFFAAIAWIQLLGPQGYLARLFLQVFGMTAVPWNIYSAGGIVFVLTAHYFILVFITVAGALERMDVSLEEAARASGATTDQIMRQITLPLVLPAIMAGGLLAFIGALANFGIPALLGMRARFFVLTTSIYYALAIPDFGLATALSSLLVLVALVSVAVQFGIQRGENRFTVISGKAVHPSELKLRSVRYALLWLRSAFVISMSML
ncbi:MAG TPA: ABC transporter permease subunit, partial [Candidatus Binatia bacterium]